MTWTAPGLRDRIVADAAALPLGNQAALLRVAILCEQPLSSARGVALEAGRDEGFAALLLRLANSAYYGGGTRIADLSSAVTRLGFALVQGLAIAAPGLRLLKGPRDGLGRARGEIHRHAVRTGIAARLLAPEGVDPEQALAAGLLHNLGLNVLSMTAPDEFRELLAAAERGVALGPFELETLGFTHAELGALLAERWSYPLALVRVIRDHDSDTPFDRLSAVVRLADLLVREAGCGIESPLDPAPSAAHARIALAKARERLEPLLAAQDRLDTRMEQESPPEQQPQGPPPGALSEALDQLR
jgi:HD-like signal output (HDOD) protein